MRSTSWVGCRGGTSATTTLKAAVSRVLTGRNRLESDRWIAFRSHYGFDAFYCQPGVDGAHEKGGVEGEGGRFRRTHCVPMPDVDSIAELNELLAAADAKDEHRRIANRLQTVGHDGQLERASLRPLPSRAVPDLADVDPAGSTGMPGSRSGSALYSVPAKLIGRTVRVQLGASRLRSSTGRRQVAAHERVDGPRRPVVDLGPLPGGPGPQAGGVARGDRAGPGPEPRAAFTPTHDAFWAMARARLGDAAGTRALVEVLLLHRRMPVCRRAWPG